MGIAEDEIRRAYPSGGEPRELFLACCPSALIQGLTDDVFRAHAREQVARSRSRTPHYELATEAEILAGLLQAATVAPLRTPGMVLADELFRRVMGLEAWAKLNPSTEPTREEWPGQFNEELTAARRRVRTGR